MSRVSSKALVRRASAIGHGFVEASAPKGPRSVAWGESPRLDVNKRKYSPEDPDICLTARMGGGE
jgi:hypothetical protein